MHTFPVMAFDLFGSIGRCFDALMQPLYWAISALMIAWHWLFSLFLDPHAGLTWVLVILGVVVVVRSAMVPLFIKQMRSTRAMSTIQPKLQELQKKYGSNRELLGQETMKLYKEEGVNPMASCLPLLATMPVLWALFTVMNGAARGQAQGMFRQHPELMDSLRNAEFLGAKLSGTFLPLPNGHFGSTQMLAAVLVLGMVVSMFYIQWQMMAKNMTPEALNGQFAQQQKMMMYIFPLSYLFFGLSIPVGVLVYWMFANIWTLVQQTLFIHHAPAPGTPAYVDWEERMRAKGLDPREIERERAEKRLKNRQVASVAAQDGEVPRVARQDLSGKTSRPVVRRQSTSGSTSASAEDAKGPVVVRQQPRKQTRSVRRKG